MKKDKFSISLIYGNSLGASFKPHVIFEVIKSKATAKFHQMKLSTTATPEPLLLHRVASTWLNDGGQAMVYLDESTFKIVLQRDEGDDKKFVMELTDPQVSGGSKPRK